MDGNEPELVEPAEAPRALASERLTRPVRSAVHARERGFIATDEPGAAPTAPTTFRLAGRGRGPAVVIAVIAVFLTVAWIKPWPAAAPRVALVPAVPARPTPAPTADPLADLKYHCQEPSGWRVYARERWAGLALRSWRTMDPGRDASGPLDPAIPVIPLGAAIVNLGYCSPWNTTERPPAGAELSAWRITWATALGTGREATPVELRSTAPNPATVVAGLFAPPSSASEREARGVAMWPAGRWVFAVRGTGYERWWAIDVQIPAQPIGPLPLGG